MIKDIIIHILREVLVTTHPRPFPSSPGSPPQNTRQGDSLARHRATRRHPAQPRALGARRPPRHPSRARLRKSPSRRPARSPAGATCSKPSLTTSRRQACKRHPTIPLCPARRSARISQLTHNALHANDISHMMKRRLKDGSLPRRVRPTPSAPPSSPTCSARTCRSQATPIQRTTRLYNRWYKKVTRNIVERISILKKTAVIRLPSMKPAASRRAR